MDNLKSDYLQHIEHQLKIKIRIKVLTATSEKNVLIVENLAS
jgi:hypothetical protein